MEGDGEPYSESIKTSNMELFAKINNGRNQFTIFKKGATFNVGLGSTNTPPQMNIFKK